MKLLKKYRVFLFLKCILLTFFLTIAKAQSPDRTLAKVGNKIITVNEFKARSELTIRPFNFKDKYTTLNNLILEKILALEAEKAKYASSPVLDAYLKGIKEQQMRRQLFFETAYKQIKVDSAEIFRTYINSKREYELEFYIIPNKRITSQVKFIIDTMAAHGKISFEEIEKVTSRKSMRVVKYDDNDDDVIHEALYTKLLDTGAVVGPLELSDGRYILMKVNKWKDYPLISGEEQQIRWRNVKKIIYYRKAEKAWRKYQAELLKDKKVEFNKNSLELLSNIAMGKFFSKQKETTDVRLAEFGWEKSEVNFGNIFFTVDNKAWTINDFRQEIASHPLVYRSKPLDSADFKEQFYLAVIDLIRDHYLNQAAYKKSLDQHVEANKVVNLWKDAMIASAYQKKVIDEGLTEGLIDESDYLGRNKYWESYISNLKEKYSKTIWIDKKVLDSITLTNLDMVAIRPRVPYPLEMPQFPIFLASDNLDYAKLNAKDK